MAPSQSDQIREALHAELAPLRDDIAALRRAVSGEDGLLVRTAVLAQRVDTLESSVRLGTPVDPKRRSSDHSDEGALTLRASPRALGRLLSVLLGGAATGGGVVWWLAPLIGSPPSGHDAGVHTTPPAHVEPAPRLPAPPSPPSPLLPAAVLPGVTDAPDPEPLTEPPRDVRRPAPARPTDGLQESR